MVRPKVLILCIAANEGEKRVVGGSEKRCEKVYEYLTKHGINSKMFYYKKKFYDSIIEEINKGIYDVVIGLPRSLYHDERITKKGIFKINIANFTEAYSKDADMNIVISKHDLLKFELLGMLDRKKSKYIPNPLMVKKVVAKKLYEKKSDKEIVIGRLARKEPSKWSPTPMLLVFYSFLYAKRPVTFVFAGMPLLYKIQLALLSPVLGMKKIKIKTYDELSGDAELSSFYSSLDIFLQTSDIGESFGNVIIESFYFGVPVISDIKFALYPKLDKRLYDAQVEHIEQGKTGWLFTYPSTVFKIINSYGIKEAENMSKHCKKYASSTVWKNIGQTWKKLVLEKQADGKNIEKLLSEFRQAYITKVKSVITTNKKISVLERVSFNCFYFVLKLEQLLYLLIRKVLRKLGFNLEGIKFNL